MQSGFHSVTAFSLSGGQSISRRLAGCGTAQAQQLANRDVNIQQAEPAQGAAEIGACPIVAQTGERVGERVSVPLRRPRKNEQKDSDLEADDDKQDDAQLVDQ